jgi:hypothetical protein
MGALRCFPAYGNPTDHWGISEADSLQPILRVGTDRDRLRQTPVGMIVQASQNVRRDWA